MTIYALDLGQVQQTIRDTLAERVLRQSTPAMRAANCSASSRCWTAWRRAWPGIRVRWPRPRRAPPTSAPRWASRQDRDTPTESGELSALREHRASIAAALSSAYANGIDPAIVGAVAEFTTADIQAEISPGLRRGLPD